MGRRGGRSRRKCRVQGAVPCRTLPARLCNLGLKVIDSLADNSAGPAGAGRKPAPPPTIFGDQPSGESVLTAALTHKDPLTFLLAVMNDGASDARLRVDAAKAALPFTHHKLGEGGKKDEQADKAKKAGAGKFAASAPPLKLVAR